MDRLKTFETLLQECKNAVERTVFFRISLRADAEDVLQEVYLTAYRQFDTLMDPLAFKAWIISIARNKCVDYYRKRATRAEWPMEMPSGRVMIYGRCGVQVQSIVRETLGQLTPKDQNILKLHYFQELPQAEIAKKLQIPLGTVKSRLHTAKENFRELYPFPPQKFPPQKHAGKNLQERKDEMKKEGKVQNEGATILPERLPEYSIEKSTEPPFEVLWEEMQGWMIVPRLGQQLTWGLYELPSRRRKEYTELAVTGRACVHGIEGVEIVAVQYDAENYFKTGSVNEMERRFVAQLTDTHSRYLAESHMEDGVHKFYTFLDGDSFTKNWGFGEDNCGNEIHVKAKGILRREGNDIKICTGGIGGSLDVVGRYTVTIAGKAYDTICVMDVESFDDAIVTESYIDENGRTVLWRRFNSDDWAIGHFGGKKWSEKLPDNEKLTVDGKVYVHWYDCITDYIL